jgi:23S rRNA pseudouridine2605 synthase
MSKQRLQKILASAGIDSRRKCEELILQGVVRVNGRVVDTLPVFADAEEDTITVNGRQVRSVRKVYFLLNKPKGVICTNFDPQGRTKAIDLIPVSERIFCVGRLDIDTAGLIILTNDSELANRLTHPRYELPKTYIAVIKGPIDIAAAEKLKKGVRFVESKTSSEAVRILRSGAKESFIEIIIRQALSRQISWMLAKAKLSLKSLKRTQIGKLDDKGVGIGKFRTLTKSEIAYLNKVTSSRQKLDK